MPRLPCPYLNAEVELSDERKKHIAEHHPDLIPEYFDAIVETLADPDLIRQSTRAANGRLFSKWYNNIKGGHHVVVVVISDQDSVKEHWVITAYITGKLAEGDIEWEKN